MASPVHLQILNRGVKEWNNWRVTHPEIIPDLSGADLNERNLAYADFVQAEMSGVLFSQTDLRHSLFVKANLRAAYLTGAIAREARFEMANLASAYLNGADLFRADLTETELSGANFTKADLSMADLGRSFMYQTILRDANLTDANLCVANLNQAIVDGALFRDATMGDTTLACMDLSSAKALEKVAHSGPSSMGMDTLLKSKGQIPESFLRGVGLPDSVIKYAKSFTTDQAAFFSCFISYSSKDQNFADKLHGDLQDNGVRCWLATEDLKIGDKFRVTIDEAIQHHEKLLIVLSKNSIHSDWVEKEVETAMERERQLRRLVLVPIWLDDSVKQINTGWAADIRRTRHIGDFTQWKKPPVYKKGFATLLKALSTVT